MHRIVLLFIAVAGISTVAHAQQPAVTCGGGTVTAKSDFNASVPACAVTHSVGAVVPYFAKLSLSPGVPTVTLDAVTASHMNAGVSPSKAGPAITVAANFDYVLTATTTGFTTVDGYTKSSAALEVGVNTIASTPASFAGLGSPLALATGNGATATAGRTIFAYYRMKLAWQVDKPATYSATVTYTLTAP